MAKNSTGTAKVIGKPFVEGQSGNPNGRPKGQRNFATIYREAIEKIAASKDMTAEAFEIELAEQAIRKGFNGDTRFYTDTMDRVHGKAMQKTDITSDGEGINQVLVKFIHNDGKTDSDRDTD